MFNDSYLKQFIPAAKSYYFLEQLREKELFIKRHGKRYAFDINIFDKLDMYIDGKKYWEIAAHFGMSEGGATENVKRARLKTANYVKLFHKGLA